MQRRHQGISERKVELLVNIKEVWPYGHGGVTHKGKQGTAVHQEIRGESLGADSVEDGRVDVEGFEVNSAGKVWVKTLGQPLADRQLNGYHWVLLVSKEYLQ